MAFGDNPNDRSLREGWHVFCDQIKEAADYVFKDESGASDGERTNAFRYLTQNLSQAFDIFLENRIERYPNLHGFCGPTRKLGADNPDCIYLQSWINDRDTYKVSGNRGTAKMFNIAVQGAWTGSLHEPFGDKPIDNIFGEELETEWDGSFVLWISPNSTLATGFGLSPVPARSSTVNISITGTSYRRTTGSNGLEIAMSRRPPLSRPGYSNPSNEPDSSSSTP